MSVLDTDLENSYETIEHANLKDLKETSVKRLDDNGRQLTIDTLEEKQLEIHHKSDGYETIESINLYDEIVSYYDYIQFDDDIFSKGQNSHVATHQPKVNNNGNQSLAIEKTTTESIKCCNNKRNQKLLGTFAAILMCAAVPVILYAVLVLKHPNSQTSNAFERYDVENKTLVTVASQKTRDVIGM